MQDTTKILLDAASKITPKPRVHYINHFFTVPEGATKVGLKFTFHKEKLAQYFISLHDPNGFRGNRMNPMKTGDVELELWVAQDDSGEGGIAGEIPAGEWRAQIDIERTIEETDYRLQVYAEFGQPAAPFELEITDKVVNDEAGWYKGELHCHSTESDGHYVVQEVVKEASRIGLDYLAMTDHFTTSQWRKLEDVRDLPIALLHSCEITSHQGHANLHGLKEWVDVYVDRDGWTMNQAADATHAQHGLFCVNHAYSGDLRWHDFSFDWNNADIIEIYHNLEGCNNGPMLSWWDHLLNSGYRIVGVGGIDSHDPYKGTHKLGQLVTWIYADELSEQGILAGIRRGQVYISKGPQLRFTAQDSHSDCLNMWESASCADGPVKFSAEVLCDQPARIFIIKNGLIFAHLELENEPGEWKQFTFEDKPDKTSFYRIEVHTDTGATGNPKYPGIYWRDYTSMLALSNPIWINVDEK